MKIWAPIDSLPGCNIILALMTPPGTEASKFSIPTRPSTIIRSIEPLPSWSSPERISSNTISMSRLTLFNRSGLSKDSFGPCESELPMASYSMPSQFPSSKSRVSMSGLCSWTATLVSSFDWSSVILPDRLLLPMPSATSSR